MGNIYEKTYNPEENVYTIYKIQKGVFGYMTIREAIFKTKSKKKCEEKFKEFYLKEND